MPFPTIECTRSPELKQETAEQELARLKQLERNRYDRFKKIKEEEGYTRKSFWLRLDPEDFAKLVIWLKTEKPRDLIALINMLQAEEASIKELIDLYESYRKSKFEVLHSQQF